MTSPSGFSDNLLHFVNLGLGATDCAELYKSKTSLVCFGRDSQVNWELRREVTNSLLGELPGTLVLRVPQQFNNATLVGCETGDLLDDFADEGSAV